MRSVFDRSNNPLSYTENNGKTILSYFANWDAVDVMQVYFRPEMPDAVCGASAKYNCRYDIFPADRIGKC